MSNKLKTNCLEANFNFSEIDKDYDIYKIETTDKYIPEGLSLLDKSNSELKARSVVYEYGKSFYVLFYKDQVSLYELIETFECEERGDTLKFSKVLSSNIPSHLLLQLFINQIGNPEHSYSFNNLTGRFLVYNLNWLPKTEGKFISGFNVLEVKVDKQMCINLRARQMNSTALKNKMEFGKKKINQYPQYTFTNHKNTLRRVNDNEKNQKENYIIKPLKGRKGNIPFLKYLDKESFESGKMGVLFNVLLFLEKNYKEYFTLNLKEYKIDKMVELKPGDISRFTKRLEEMVGEKEINLIDNIKDEYSNLFLNKVKMKIHEIFPGSKITMGKKISKNKFNIKLIHDKDYYEDSKDDPYFSTVKGAAVQHITFEDFNYDENLVMENTIKELVIKEDINNNKISMIDWQSFGFDNKWIFGVKHTVEDKDDYYFMEILPDGSFNIQKKERNLFNIDEFDKYIKYFDKKEVMGIVKDSLGNVNLIKDNNLFSIPDIFKLGKDLNLAAEKIDFPGEYLVKILDKLNYNGEAYFKIGKNYSKNEIQKIIENRNIKKEITKAIFEDTGELLKLYSRDKYSREKYFTGVTEINYIKLNEKEALYNVGEKGSGMNTSISKSSIIRKIEAIEESELIFEKLLPLMGVYFVRYKMPTVIPFPFKYLREYIG